MKKNNNPIVDGKKYIGAILIDERICCSKCRKSTFHDKGFIVWEDGHKERHMQCKYCGFMVLEVYIEKKS